ncbi:YdaU family protein [Microvirga sp. GCM10011540]|uniref:YdaU family protein n=1 Tax=Microvirga sp. GCM10011540 TaxID=3317338 RepID=UPI00361EECEF
MSQYPSLPLFTDAYIADTAHLTNEEHGAYLRLLMFAWRSPDCSLPDDDVKLARMLGLTPKKWAALKVTVMAFWSLKDGRWLQSRLSRERQFVEEKIEKRRDAGKLGGRPKSLNYQEAVKAKGSQEESKPKAPTPTPILPSEERAGMRLPENMQARMLAELPPGVDWPIRISMDLRPIFACLEAGADFEKHILPTIHEEARLAHAGGRKLFKWENVTPQIMAAVEREKRPTDRKDQNGFTDEAWGQIIERWKRTGLWSYGKWSLPPDFPGCSIPAHVLAAHGFGKAAA